MLDSREILLRCHAAAIEAVQPSAAMARALEHETPRAGPSWIIGAGKASPGMAAALVAWLAAHQREPAGGILIAAGNATAPHPAIAVHVGDHPVPGAASVRAADALADSIRRIPSDASVHVLISGGASSLMAGPLPGIGTDDVVSLFRVLLSSGLDIHEMNAIRKRLTRWSAGRLAVAISPRPTFTWIMSDVPGDDIASIGSGPCSGDPWTTTEVQRLLARAGIIGELTEPVLDLFRVETPKPGDGRLESVRTCIVASNRDAVHAAVAAGQALGLQSVAMAEPLHGEAAEMGRTIACSIAHSATPGLQVWGGETTVTIRGESPPGGRAQELALAAAGALRGKSVTLFSASTDGRDGTTDAAGAMVDGRTWNEIIDTGRDPSKDLTAHDAYASLEAVAALVRSGPTGTNVMDLVLTLTGHR